MKNRRGSVTLEYLLAVAIACALVPVMSDAADAVMAYVVGTDNVRTYWQRLDR